jgi:ribonucleotide reductase beta subunit family protein with ferritin-like domain
MNIYNYISIILKRMPRKKSDENLAKLVCSNISLEVFDTLQKFAKIYYNNNTLKQPTISHLVRFILNDWARSRTGEYRKVLRSRDDFGLQSSSGLRGMVTRRTKMQGRTG